MIIKMLKACVIIYKDSEFSLAQANATDDLTEETLLC